MREKGLESKNKHRIWVVDDIFAKLQLTNKHYNVKKSAFNNALWLTVSNLVLS